MNQECSEMDRLNGSRKTLFVPSKAYITCGGDQETLLNRQLQRMLSSLEDMFLGRKAVSIHWPWWKSS